MKKFIVKITIIAIILFGVDRIIGYSMKYVNDHIEVGGMGRDNYICNEADEDILIFGSSRAVHHYNAKMIEDSLGLSCYNCGDDGNGVILNYARLLMCKERKSPKYIIFDVASGFDLELNDNHKYLSWIRNRFDRKGVSDIFKKIDEKEAYKMLCHTYRYNTRFLQNLIVYITGISSDAGIQGFRPIHEEFDMLKIKNNREVKPLELDSIKFFYLKEFIKESKESTLIFVYSPIWYGADKSKVQPLIELCKENNISYIDFSNDSKYIHNNRFFKDGTHLNATGADEFTKDFINILRFRYNTDTFAEK